MTGADEFDKAMQLVDEARRQQGEGAMGRAMRLLDESLKYVNPELHPRERAAILNNLASFAYQTGDIRRAQKAWQQTLGLAKAHELRDIEAMALANLALILDDHGDPEGAEERHRAAQDIYEEIGDLPGFARQLGNRGMSALRRGNHAMASLYLEKAMGAFQVVGNPAEASRCRVLLGECARHVGDVETAKEHFDTALAAYRELGDGEGQAVVLNQLGGLLKAKGELSSAAEAFTAALALYEHMGHPRGMAAAHTNLGNVAMAAGSLDEARLHFHASYDLNQSVGFVQGTAGDLANMGQVEEYLGRPLEAFEHYEAALETYKELGSAQGIVSSNILVAKLAMERGDMAIAKLHFDAARLQAGATSFFMGELVVTANMGRIRLFEGQLELAEGIFRRLKRSFGEVGADVARHGAVAGIGEVLFERGERQKADRYFREAAKFFDSRGHNLEWADAQVMRARVASRGARPERALALIDEPLDLYRAHGYVVHEASARLVSAWAHVALGRYTEARELVDAVRATGLNATHPRLDCRLLVLSARLEAEDDPALGLLALEKTIDLAEALVDVPLMAEAWEAVAAVLESHPADPEEADRLRIKLEAFATRFDLGARFHLEPSPSL